tara:strand:+ start:308 stop:553 length:246 start_codon:yes stop_codon:yes gene_type:complete
MAYYTIANTGKGFITHADNESSHVAGYPGDVWVTSNSTWATRVSATSQTKVEAQALVDAAISGSYYLEGENSGSQVVITLP